MPYISLTKAALNGKNGNSEDDEKRLTEKRKKIFRHPVRDRILGILRDGKARTQSDLGKILTMSNAAVHYHVKLLLEVGIIKLHSTRPGPNGITEKLYAVDTENWPVASEDDVNYYIDYMVSWMNERHREGVNILKSERDDMPPFLAGSYSVSAPMPELLQFKREVEKLFNDFYMKYEDAGDEKKCLQKISFCKKETFAVTFAILPSREKKAEDSRNILEFEPDAKES
jgi:DNA-binding Lrp family transcriptional regulator